MNNKELVKKAIPRHVEIWRKILCTSGSTNRQLAEENINDLYKRLKKQPPQMIVWCDSPYQIAVLPTLIATVVDSSEWRNLSDRWKSGLVDEDLEWKNGWKRIETNLEKTFEQILHRPNDFAMDAEVSYNAKTRLSDILHQALREKKFIGSDWIMARAAKHMPVNFRRTGPYSDILKHSVLLGQHVHAVAGITLVEERLALSDRATLGPQQDQQQRLGQISALVTATTQGLSWGLWDKRLLTDFVPATEGLINRTPADCIETARDIKRLCGPLEQIAGARQAWYMRLPAMRNRLTAPEYTDQLQNAFSNLGKDNFEKTRNFVKNSFNELSNIQNMVLEDFGFRNHATNWFPSSIGWLPFALACCQIEPPIFGDECRNDLERIALMAHAASGYYFLPKIVFACKKPEALTCNVAGRPHNSTGPAARWSDGYKIFSWNGIIVEPRVIENIHNLSAADIMRERNTELRRVMINAYGEARYLMDAGAKVLHADETGTLYTLEQERDEAIVMVKVKNSTPDPDGSFKYYFLRVPPWITRARQAVAWSFGLQESEYHPQTET